MIAGVAAAQEKSDSPVATLGYSCTGSVRPYFLDHLGHHHRRPHDVVKFE
jgi:hypothetical protein